MRALKEANPKAYAEAKAAHFDLKARQQVHPTVKAAREEHALVARLGGAKGIQTMQEDSRFFKTAAQSFMKGDPAFINDLWEEDAIAAALHTHGQLEAHRKHDPQGFNKEICNLWEAEFQQVGWDKAVNGLREAINAGDKKAAMAMLDSFHGWKQSISDLARRGEDPRVKSLLAERSRQHEQAANAERETFLKDYRTEAVNGMAKSIDTVFNSYFRNRKLSDDDTQDLKREVARLLNRAMMDDKEWWDQREEHLANGDRESALQLTQAFCDGEKGIKAAVQKVARRYGLVSMAPKQPSKETPKGGQPTPGRPPVKGFVLVNTRPSPEDIDREATALLAGGNYASAIISKRAVLRNGKKVDWSRVK